MHSLCSGLKLQGHPAILEIPDLKGMGVLRLFTFCQKLHSQSNFQIIHEGFVNVPKG